MVNIRYIFTLFLVFTIFPLEAQNISNIIAGAKEGSGELNSIYDLDVFTYFNLTNYNTELQQTVFKKSAEYQTKLSELKTIKTQMLKSIYYTKMTDSFNETEYDIKRKGFEIELGNNWGMGTASARTPKSVYLDYGRILLKALPVKLVPEPILGQGIYGEKLFFQMTEEYGLQIENDKENTEIYFFFTPNGREKSTFKFYNSVGSGYSGWYNITHNDLKSDYVRIVITNKQTGKIFYDKSFTYQPISKG